MEYDFGDKLREGEGHETTLDSFFSRYYRVTPVNMALQRLGIDRVFEAEDGYRWTVEYKADATADATGNAFIETVSVDTNGKPGWALTSVAQLLVYYVPPQGIIYIAAMCSIKWALRDWKKRYRLKSATNNGYKTWGVVVPIEELRRISHCVMPLAAVCINTAN